MKRTLPAIFLLSSLLPVTSWADVAPASLKGLEVRLVLQGARQIDSDGNSSEIPGGPVISIRFDDDCRVTQAPGMAYNRILPATATIDDYGCYGKGQWTLYFSSSCEGSASFTGTVRGKRVCYEDVYFVIGAQPVPKGGEQAPNHRSIAISGDKEVYSEIVMHPTPKQLAVMKESPYMETDMVFGSVYRPEKDSQGEEVPLVAVRHQGDKGLTWGGWRNRARGTSLPVCYPGTLAFCQSGDDTIINLTPENAPEFARYTLSFDDCTAEFRFVTRGGVEKTVKGIPFTVQDAPKPSSFRGCQFQKLPAGSFGFSTPVRACFVDSTVVAILRQTGRDASKQELVVMTDVEGALDWKVVHRQTLNLPCPIEAVAVFPDDSDSSTLILWNTQKGGLLAPGCMVRLPGKAGAGQGVQAPASLKGKRLVLQAAGDEGEDQPVAVIAFPDSGTKGKNVQSIESVTHAFYFPSGNGSSAATLELVNNVQKAMVPANRFVLHFKNATSGTAEIVVWDHAPHRVFSQLSFRVEPLDGASGDKPKRPAIHTRPTKGGR